MTDGTVGVVADDAPADRAGGQDDVGAGDAGRPDCVIGTGGGTRQAVGVHIRVGTAGILNTVDGARAGVCNGDIDADHLRGVVGQRVSLGDGQSTASGRKGDRAVGIASGDNQVRRVRRCHGIGVVATVGGIIGRHHGTVGLDREELEGRARCQGVSGGRESASSIVVVLDTRRSISA